MSVTNLQLKLKGREEKVRCRDRVRCSCKQPLLHEQGSTKGVVARGCAKFGVSVPSDLARRDGKSLRHEMHVSGEWTVSVSNKKGKKEWVAAIKGRSGLTLIETRVSSSMICLRLNRRLV
jgi:hypothetical protein